MVAVFVQYSFRSEKSQILLCVGKVGDLSAGTLLVKGV